MNDSLGLSEKDEEFLLKHENFITKILKIRAENDTQTVNMGIFQILNSTAFTTFLTVVVGGLLTQWVITSVQYNQKKNEQALSEYRQYLGEQQETAKTAFDLIGRVSYVTQIKSDLTLKQNQVSEVPEGQRPTRQKEIDESRKKIDSTVEEWNIQKEKLGLLMSYYHYGNPKILDDWRITQNNVDDYIVCVNELYYKFNLPEAITDEDYGNCDEKKEKNRNSLREFANVLNQSRQYAWQQQNIPLPKFSPEAALRSPNANKGR